MTGRLRYVLAAAFVALFFLIPGADHDHLAFLQVRSWLTADDTPFITALVKEQGEGQRQPKRLPLLQATTPLLGPDPRRAEYERILREWARGKGHVPDENLPPMHLHVVVGSKGFSSTLLIQVEGKTKEFKKSLLRDSTGRSGYYPDRWSLLPAFLAIVLAILSGKVIPSLFLGCLAGAWLYRAQLVGGVTHLFANTIYGKVLTEEFNVRIMCFVIFLFMCVGVMTRAGGIQGMVELIRKYAKGPVSSQICSFIIGILIFFDDYSNCIITGTTMRPLTDRNRVSREKLAYIVDSTAAPIAGICIFSTWVAYEVSMFAPQLPEVTHADGTPYQQTEGFSVFVATLPYRFYCIFTLVMVLLTIVMRREFGSMLAAEQRVAKEGKVVADDAEPMVSKSFAKLEPRADIPHRARNALLPIGLLVVLTLSLIFYFGYTGAKEKGADLGGGMAKTLQTVLEHTASERALFWASLCALILAAILALVQGILSLGETLLAAWRSAKSLGFAVIILILAWSIGNTCGDVGTNQFLTAAFHGSFTPWLLPAILFLLSSLVSFSTGTSYGTMAILLPNVVVLAHSMGQDSELGGPGLMVLTIGAVLEGSIFGDHCSPISDTTVLSSVATGSDHLHHVRTQAPYAVFVMLLAMCLGYLPMALLGLEWWPLSWVAGIVAIILWLRFVGRRPDAGVLGAS